MDMWRGVDSGEEWRAEWIVDSGEEWIVDSGEEWIVERSG